MQRLLRSVDYLFRRHVLRRPYLIAKTNYSGLRLRVKTEDVVGRRLFKHGTLEAECIQLVEGHVQIDPGDVLVDAGANVGWYSLVLDRLAPAGVDIYAFEPDPENFALLDQNLAMNGATHVHAVRYALADRAGRVPLYLYPEKNRGRHSLLPINTGRQVEIDAVPLDEFWNQHSLGERRLGFMKMDIEGYELFALRGARSLLRRCAALLVEYSPAYMHKAGVQPAELYDLLATAGMHANEIDGAGNLMPSDRARVLGSERQRNLFWQRR